MKTFVLPLETRWDMVRRRMKKGSSFISKVRRSEPDAQTQLFGQPLGRICSDDGSLPKPVAVSQLLIVFVSHVCLVPYASQVSVM